jgi:hypothetical protein
MSNTLVKLGAPLRAYIIHNFSANFIEEFVASSKKYFENKNHLFISMSLSNLLE